VWVTNARIGASRSKKSLASYRKFRRAIPCINDKLNHYFDYRRLVITTGYIVPDVAPDTAQEKPSQGEVTAVGPGGRDEAGKLIPIDLKVGDRVLFGKWSGTEVKIDDVELLIMKESDIMGVLDQSMAKKKAA
jgi:chaperonin GroES